MLLYSIIAFLRKFEATSKINGRNGFFIIFYFIYLFIYSFIYLFICLFIYLFLSSEVDGEIFVKVTHFPANIYLVRVNHRNNRKRCGICSKSTIKTPEWRQWRRSGVFFVNFEHTLHLFLEFLLLTLSN